jgi:hypothetical protein
MVCGYGQRPTAPKTAGIPERGQDTHRLIIVKHDDDCEFLTLTPSMALTTFLTSQCDVVIVNLRRCLRRKVVPASPGLMR